MQDQPSAQDAKEREFPKWDQRNHGQIALIRYWRWTRRDSVPALTTHKNVVCKRQGDAYNVRERPKVWSFLWQFGQPLNVRYCIVFKLERIVCRNRANDASGRPILRLIRNLTYACTL